MEPIFPIHFSILQCIQVDFFEHTYLHDTKKYIVKLSNLETITSVEKNWVVVVGTYVHGTPFPALQIPQSSQIDTQTTPAFAAEPMRIPFCSEPVIA